MFRYGVRRFTTTAYKAVEHAPKLNMASVQLAKAQGYVNGFVGGNTTVTRRPTVNPLNRL
jgi:hypothetical protein